MICFLEVDEVEEGREKEQSTRKRAHTKLCTRLLLQALGVLWAGPE